MQETQTRTRPNVIVFFTDQQRWDTTGLHGNPLDLTPNFDRMARRGTHFAHAFTPQPVCGPARAAFQTGRYATETGCWRNGIPLPATEQTMAHHFNDAGYATGYIGKWHLGTGVGAVAESERGGYRHWLAANAVEMVSDAYDAVLFDGDNAPVKLPGYRVDALTDAAIRYVDAHKDVPFYLFLSFLEPHHQNHRDDYPAPHGYAERYMGRYTPPDLQALGGSAAQHLPGYFGMVKRLDEALGRLLDALVSLDLDENTIVLFTSDHGCHFKTRNAEYKRSCHDGSLRVPAAAQGPGFDGGGRVPHLVTLLDFTASLLDAARIPVPAAMQGRSVLPLLRHEAADWPEEVFAQISESQVGRCVRTRRWKYSAVAPEKDGRTDASSDRYTEEFLYDLLADPYELTNLIGHASHAEVSAIMRARLVRRMVAAGEDAPEIVPAPVPSRPGGQRRVSAAEARA